MFTAGFVSNAESQAIKRQDTTILTDPVLESKAIKPFILKKTAPVVVVSRSGVAGDARITVLRSFLQKKGSYLAEYAELIVEQSDVYGVDYRLIVAISGVESGYCKVNFRPFNCWGFGKYGWSDASTAIKEYFALMNKGYFSKGKKTPETIASPYNPWPEKYVQKVYMHWNQIY